MQPRLWQRMTAVLLMSVLARGSVYAVDPPPLPCPASCVDQKIVYTRGEAGARAEERSLPTIDIVVPRSPLINDDLAQKVPAFSFSERFTAQRKPRLAVLPFQDENRDAHEPLYSASIESMLVTFLKRKSQFTVVERERMGDVLEEWKLGRAGRTNLKPSEGRELFESVDAIVMGSVTLLEAPNDINTTSGNSDGSNNNDNHRTEMVKRIEVDLKALGRSDGRIIAAARSSGPVHCMRSIVERLGVALEEGFLRPYYGSLQFALSSPDNVRIYLTPILINKARDDEKPPVERGESLIQGTGQDSVEPWTTNPTSYTLKNVLGGWYTVRLERPGYEGMGIVNGNEEFQVHELGGKAKVFYQKRDELSGAPLEEPVSLEQAPEDLRKYVVYVDSRETRVFDGDNLRLKPVKLGGSIAPLVRRQYLDRQPTHTPKRVVLVGKGGLDINRVDRLKEYGDDQTCDVFNERSPSKISYGRTYVTAEETFDFDSFRGGDLIIENYKGEPLPAGQYQIAYWEPGYDLLQGIARVNQGDNKRTTPASLVRKTLPLKLSTMGPRNLQRMTLTGKMTRYEAEIPLNFLDLPNELPLPVDQYEFTTNVPSLSNWKGSLVLLPETEVAPTFDIAKEERRQQEKEERKKEKARQAREARRSVPPVDELEELEAELQEAMPLQLIERNVLLKTDKAPPLHTFRIKTRLGVGGRLTALSSTAQFASSEIFLDYELASLFDNALNMEGSTEERPAPAAAKPPSTPPEPSKGDSGTAKPSTSMEQNTGDSGADGTSGGGATADKPPAQSVPQAESPQTESRVSASPLSPQDLLAQRLETIDLLVLDDKDMSRVREHPEVASILERYVLAGGALFAFISEEGDYGSFLGGPLSLKAIERSSRFDLSPGDVGEIYLMTGKVEIALSSDRAVLQPEDSLDGNWRVLAYGQGSKRPRLFERGDQAQGGYVAIWLDQPDLFQSRFSGGRIPDVEAARADVEKRVLNWARYLAYRRYDEKGDALRRAKQALEEPARPVPTVTAEAVPTAAPVVAPAPTPTERLAEIEKLRKQKKLSRREYKKLRKEILASMSQASKASSPPHHAGS